MTFSCFSFKLDTSLEAGSQPHTIHFAICAQLLARASPDANSGMTAGRVPSGERPLSPTTAHRRRSSFAVVGEHWDTNGGRNYSIQMQPDSGSGQAATQRLPQAGR